MRYYICEPYLDQSYTIASWLARYKKADLHGLVMEGMSLVDRRYKSVFPLREVDLFDTDGCLIPTGAASTKYLLERQDVYLGQVALTQSAIRVYDKFWMLKQVEQIGIPSPVTWHELEEVSMVPFFYKQYYEIGGGIRGIARRKSDVPRSDLKSLMFQELIESRGTYGVSFLADRGKILTYHVHHEVESYPDCGGSAVIIENYNNKRLLEYSEELISGLGYSGWGLCEYKYCPRREDFVFMELNAKFWASCEFTFRNNPSFVYLLFDIDYQPRPVERMIFLERAFLRGVPFVISRLFEITSKGSVYTEEGWFIRTLVSRTPRFLISFAKRLLIHRSTSKKW
jgi:hypothetical protein